MQMTPVDTLATSQRVKTQCTASCVIGSPSTLSQYHVSRAPASASAPASAPAVPARSLSRDALCRD